MKCFQSSVGQKAIKGRRNRANTILREAQLFVHVFIVGANNPHDDIGMATNILGDRMDDNIGPQVQGVLKIRRTKGVVNRQEALLLVTGLRDHGNVSDLERRIGWRLQPD